MNKIKNITIAFGFVVTISMVFILNIIAKDKNISITERRTLATFPKITLDNVMSGKVTDDFEKYVSDQFIARDFFRGIKSFNSFNIYRQKDNNKLFERYGAIYKIYYPLNKNNIVKAANKINEVYNSYLKGMNVYYSIIPDKNYYLKDNNHIKIDYEELEYIMNSKIRDIKYISIKNELDLSDYYSTDLHWKQEEIVDVANKIQNEMGILQNNKIQYKKIYEGEYYGTYYGQLAIKTNPDKMYVLSNDTIEKCITYNYETKTQSGVYNRKSTIDKYDIYLSGATPIVSIENLNNFSGRELIIFRDSFGSSIAPLFIENYHKITLIDLRYISSKMLNQYIKFENQDVLFIYSTLILNQNIFK